MVNLLLPVLGCGLMMAVCAALMARGHRASSEPGTASDELAALQAELMRLRAAQAQPAAVSDERPTHDKDEGPTHDN